MNLLEQENMNVSQAVEDIKKNMEITEELKDVLNFIHESTRGIIRG